MFEYIKFKINGARPQRSRLRGGRGFSLVEVLVAVGLISITIFICKSLLNGSSLARTAKNEDIALQVADYKVEELRNLGYSSLPVSGSFTDSMLSSLPSGSAAMAISDYDAKTKKVIITVSWTEAVSGAHSVSLTTLLAQTGGLK